MGEFPGRPVVGFTALIAKGRGSIPSWGTKILQAAWLGHKKRKRKKSINLKKKFLPVFIRKALQKSFLEGLPWWSSG